MSSPRRHDSPRGKFRGVILVNDCARTTWSGRVQFHVAVHHTLSL